jgi:glutamate 5-kinase
VKSKSTTKKRELWVIKAGSQMVIDGGPMLIRSWMNQVSELAKLHSIQVIWVTSGAIASARKRTGKNPKLLREKQALSAIGQPHLINHYLVALQENSFGPATDDAVSGSVSGAQILLTAEDLRSQTRRKYLQQTLGTLLEWKFLPILNENDAVATEEIQFGDNDRLAALVAVHMKAKRLVLLTDVEGLFDRDPKTNTSAKLIPELSGIPADLVRTLKGSLTQNSASLGRGGMLSKVLAAKTVTENGIHCHLVKGDLNRALIKIADQTADSPGTHIRPRRRSK